MAQQDILGTESVKDALKTKSQDNFDELYPIKTEVEAARDGETDLLTQINLLQASVNALMAGSGVPITAADTTAGYLNGKLIAESGRLTLTVGSPGGNETLTISIDEIDDMDFFYSMAF